MGNDNAFYNILHKTLSFVIVLMASSCNSIGTGQPININQVQNASPTESPYIVLLRSNGIALGAGSKVDSVFSTSIDHRNYFVIRYQTSTSFGLQIAVDNALVSDRDVAYNVLLSYAWSQAGSRMSSDSRLTRHGLLVYLQDTESKYKPFFKLAEATDPVVKSIDKLKAHEIHSSNPKLEKVLGFIAPNLWEAICLIPVDAADLCLLEPLLRETHDQGLEIQSLLVPAIADLSNVEAEMDDLQNGIAIDGRKVKEDVEKCISSLHNLRDKVDQLNTKVTKVRAIIQRMDDEINKRALLKLTLGEFTQILTMLDTKLSQYDDATNRLSVDLSSRANDMEQLRTDTDAELLDFARMWRFRPS